MPHSLGPYARPRPPTRPTRLYCDKGENDSRCRRALCRRDHPRRADILLDTSTGAVASAASEPEQTDWCHENPPSAPGYHPAICLRRLLLPARRDRAGGPLVPAVRVVVPRRRGAAHQTRRPGRPRHGLSVGAAVCAAAGRGRPALPPCRRRPLAVDETYVKVAGRWRYVYRAIDQFGQVIDVFVSRGGMRQRPAGSSNAPSARCGWSQSRLVTDHAPVYPAVLEELLPAVWHRTDRYANNDIEADHGRLKARLRPMRGLKQDRSARIVIAGHGFVQNLRRGHYELAVEEPVARRLAVALDELSLAI